ETLPGPFEYDVKRMATSFMIAARNNGFAKGDARTATQTSVTAYRDAMAGFAQMSTMDVWYAFLDETILMRGIRTAVGEIEKAGKGGKKAKKQQKQAKSAAARARKNLGQAHTRDSLQALSKLGELVDGQYRIKSQPPIVVPVRELAGSYGMSADDVNAMIRS